MTSLSDLRDVQSLDQATDSAEQNAVQAQQLAFLRSPQYERRMKETQRRQMVRSELWESLFPFLLLLAGGYQLSFPPPSKAPTSR